MLEEALENPVYTCYETAEKLVVLKEEGLLEVNQPHKKKRMEVNSFHHQAIKKLGEGLKATAKTDDGLIEAVEGTGDQFIIGFQFHPEKLRVNNSNWNKLFKAFIEEAKRRKSEVGC